MARRRNVETGWNGDFLVGSGRSETCQEAGRRLRETSRAWQSIEIEDAVLPSPTWPSRTPVEPPEPDRPRLQATIKPHGTDASEASSGQRLFLSYLPVIDSVTAKLSRRHHLRDIECQEFSSFVRLALLDRDAEVLRQYSGTGTAAAFLRVVIGRLLYDFRCELWGRWRPSAAARRHGPLGVLLERLLNRDGMSLDEAVETARTESWSTAVILGSAEAVRDTDAEAGEVSTRSGGRSP